MLYVLVDDDKVKGKPWLSQFTKKKVKDGVTFILFNQSRIGKKKALLVIDQSLSVRVTVAKRTISGTTENIGRISGYLKRLLETNKLGETGYNKDDDHLLVVMEGQSYNKALNQLIGNLTNKGYHISRINASTLSTPISKGPSGQLPKGMLPISVQMERTGITKEQVKRHSVLATLIAENDTQEIDSPFFTKDTMTSQIDNGNKLRRHSVAQTPAIRERIFLVDYENTQDRWLAAAANLPAMTNTYYVFNGRELPDDTLENYRSEWRLGKGLTFILTTNGIKNALDWQLISFAGMLIGENGFDDSYELVIISNDKGYDTIIPFWQQHGGVRIRRVGV